MNLMPDADEPALRLAASGALCALPETGLDWRGLCRSPVGSIVARAGEAGADGRLAVLMEEAGRSLRAPALGRHLAIIRALSQRAEPGLAGWHQRLVCGEVELALALQSGPRDWYAEVPRVQGRRDAGLVLLSGTVRWVEGWASASHLLIVFSLLTEHGPDVALAWVPAQRAAGGPRALPATALDGQPVDDIVLDDMVVEIDHIAVGRSMVGRLLSQLKTGLALHAAAEMVGAAQAALEATVAQCARREAFGQPLSGQQSVRHACAEMRVAVEAARLLCRQAFWRASTGSDAAVQAAQAKAFASDRLVQVGEIAQQLHGAQAVLQDHPVHRWHCRLAALGQRWGTAAEHRAFVARALLD
jgi:alkylation response protein AidB-like acyl-CoA dehydrogenase